MPMMSHDRRGWGGTGNWLLLWGGTGNWLLLLPSLTFQSKYDLIILLLNFQSNYIKLNPQQVHDTSYPTLLIS